jgi:diguanylate cyclase (GGDEF)-like protein/PAS domain S-box-containing protein
MDISIVIALMQNAALLLALVFLYDAIPQQQRRQHLWLWRTVCGMLIGIFGITLMSTPWEFSPGIIFDIRSVLLSITGLFFGGLPVLVAAVLTGLFRFSQGGEAVWAGIGVICSSALIGIGWRHFRKQHLAQIGIRELFLFGLLVHLSMLAWIFILPQAMALAVLAKIALPVLSIFVLVTVAVGMLLSRRYRSDRDSQMRLQDDFLFRSQFQAGNIGIAVSSVDRRLLKVNPRLCHMLKYTEAELMARSWTDITHEADLAPDLALYQQLLAGKVDEYEIDKRFIASDGNLVYTHVSVACKRVGGQVQLIIAGFQDVTEQKLAEQELKASREQLELVLASSDVGFWDWDIVANSIERNVRSAEIIGYTAAELREVNRIWTDAIHVDDRVKVLRALELHINGKTSRYKMQYRINNKQGELRWISDTGKVVRWDTNGKALRMCGIHIDITESKVAEEALKLAASVYDNSSEAMSVIDCNGYILNTNPAFSAITLYSSDEIRNQHVRLLHCDRNTAAFYQELNQQVVQQGYWLGEIWLRRKNGDEYMAMLTINTVYSKNGQPYRRVALFSDITEKKQSEQLIWKQANYDTLTGLPNRRMLIEYLGSEIKKSVRTGKHFALLFIDLDFFKEVNDTLGHDMGDTLLIETARRLQHCIRDMDVVARLGGDEFTLVLGDVSDIKGVERVAQQILQKIAEPYALGMETAYISASIGITLYPDDARDVDELLKHADQAMYAAKEQGRNRFNYFTPSMQELARYRMRLVQDLRTAVGNKEFEVNYQPIVELTSGRVFKAEALIRWYHPQRGQVSPAEFIPLAEDTGLIIDIGNWVFEQAAMQSVRWREQYGNNIQISVNKSPIQFRDEGAGFEEWISLLKQLGLTEGGICIEITEGLLLDASLGVSEKLLAYRDAGVQVSLDDFGTGYSSLAYLKRFDIDYLKIDQSFTRNLETDNNDRILCEAIIVMAHKLGMKVVAEGVETQAQREFLIQAGCDFGQGYLFSSPLDADEFEQKYLLQTEARHGER